LSFSIAVCTASDTAIALLPGSWKIGTATAGLLSSKERKAYSLEPSSMRATWESSTCSPFCPRLTTILPNSSSSMRRPLVLICSCVSADCESGGCPIPPAATCTFCSRIALITSFAVKPRAAILSGSSQTRIA